MELITVEKICEIHEDAIRDFGGTNGILTIATLEYLVHRVNRAKDTIGAAALAIYCIASKHPFFDGNKRTGFLVAEHLLNIEGFIIQAEEDEIVAFMLGVATYTVGLNQIEGWIQEKVRRRSELP
jgi:death-on-curing protein